MEVKTKRQIALKIADQLFRYTDNIPSDKIPFQRVQRLALVIYEGDSQRMSGWCKGSIVDIIMDELEPFKLTPKPTKKGREK